MSLPKILIIYTGGTIGMVEDAVSGQLRPFNFNHLHQQIPELNKLQVNLSAISVDKPIDSSDMHPHNWAQLAQTINDNYKQYDGFVVLHGSDTMAYTASALSFMLGHLNKPVILTGSQLPIGTIRTDGKENILTSIEIAASRENGQPTVPEVCIYFEYRLHRGNRTSKISATQFNAFSSGNYPLLAEAGVSIVFNHNAIRQVTAKELTLFTGFNHHVGIIKIFPGIEAVYLRHVLQAPGLKGAIIETFGAGNMTTDANVLGTLEEFINSGRPIVNVTQCHTGFVEQGRYETSSRLKQMGVISAHDMTTEAALAKLMMLIGQGLDQKAMLAAFDQSFCGEVTL